ncbi:MAG: tape measure protein [Candidatus Planktophila sp.]
MAQTINIANIKIGMDVDELKKGGMFTRGELASITRLAKESIDPFDRYATEMEKLQRAYNAGGLSAERFAAIQDTLSKKLGVSIPVQNVATYSQAIEQLRIKVANGSMTTDEFKRAQASLQAQLGQTTRAVNEQKTAISNQQSAISSIKNLAMTYAGLSAAVSAVKTSVKLAAEMEQTKVAFGVMTGSAAQATKLLNDFKALDIESPINFADFARAGKTMLQFGVQAEALRPTLSRLAAISLGNAEQFQSLALAFGQVQANGRLMGQEVLQMVNAGFNPLQEISRTTGVSMIELKKRMEDGAISAQMVAKAFETATSEGGRFYGMNQQLEGTMSGQFAKLESEIKAASIALGTALIPLVQQLTGLLKDVASSATSNEKTVGGYFMFLAEKASTGFAAMASGLRNMTAETMLSSVSVTGMISNLLSGRRGALDDFLDSLDDQEEAELDAAAASVRAEAMKAEAKTKANAEAVAMAEAAAKRASDEKARLSELEKSTTLYKETGKAMWDLREEFDKLTLGEQAALEAKQKRAGWMDQDIERYRLFKNRVDEARKAQELEADAAKLKEEMTSPQEKLQKELQRLEAMKALGPDKGINQQQFDALSMRAAERFQSKEDIVKDIAPALKAGTKEAFQFVQRENLQAKEKAEQKKMQEQLLAEARKANEFAANAPRLALAR